MGRRRTLYIPPELLARATRTVSIDDPMPVTKYAGNFPAIGGMVPDDQEFGLTKAFAGFDIAESMVSFLDGAISLDGINLQASCRKHAPKMTAHVLAGFIDIGLPCPGDTTFVVIKLDVCIQIARMFFELIGRTALIECAK